MGPAADASHDAPRRRGSTARTPDPRRRGHATNARSRPAAIDRGMSSAATKRTSTGTWISRPLESMNERSSRQAVGHRAAGHAVLHLVEAHEPRRGEHPVRLLGRLDVRDRLREPARDGRDRRRDAPSDAPSGLERDVLEEHLVEPLLRPGARLRRARDSVVLLGLHPFGVGEPVELEVVVPLDVLVEHLEHVVEAHRLVHRAQCERRNTPQRDRRHDTERAEPDTGRREHLSVLGTRAREHRAVTGHELHRLDERREPRRASHPCRACRSRAHLRPSDMRCRRGSRGRARAHRAPRSARRASSRPAR